MKELKLEELQGWKRYLTIKELKDHLNSLPESMDDGKVLIQRVEDFYYDQTDDYDPWSVVLKKGEHYGNAEAFNLEMEKEIARRESGEVHEYSMENPQDFIESEEDMKEYIEQYTPAFSVIKYDDDSKNLYIDLHY